MPRKGKAKHRQKDWAGTFRSMEDVAEEAADRQTLQPDRVKLGSQRFNPALAEEQLAGLPHAEGMLIGLFPGGAYVRLPAEPGGGSREVLAMIGGTFRAPTNSTALAVGDDVTLGLSGQARASGELDKQWAEAVILSRKPRRTALSRPQPTSGKRRDRYDEEPFEKVVAANMEVLLIVASTRQPAVRPALVDRYCIVAERGEMKPIVVFNKLDLAEPNQELVAELSEGGVQILRVSAVPKRGLEELAAAIAGRRSVLAGPSGVGKSSLVNALIPGSDVPTRQVRVKDDRGRHTTATAAIYELPDGGLVVDTPGVRELALPMEPLEVAWYFPDFEPFARQCRFNNCTHTHEPACAVQAAVENGRLSPRRYGSYLRILETL